MKIYNKERKVKVGKELKVIIKQGNTLSIDKSFTEVNKHKDINNTITNPQRKVF